MVTREELAEAVRLLKLMQSKMMYQEPEVAAFLSRIDASNTEAEQDLAQKCVDLVKEMAERFNWVHGDQADTFSGLRSLGEQEFFVRAAALFSEENP